MNAGLAPGLAALWCSIVWLPTVESDNTIERSKALQGLASDSYHFLQRPKEHFKLCTQAQ